MRTGECHSIFSLERAYFFYLYTQSVPSHPAIKYTLLSQQLSGPTGQHCLKQPSSCCSRSGIILDHHLYEEVPCSMADCTRGQEATYLHHTTLKSAMSKLQAEHGGAKLSPPTKLASSSDEVHLQHQKMKVLHQEHSKPCIADAARLPQKDPSWRPHQSERSRTTICTSPLSNCCASGC